MKPYTKLIVRDLEIQMSIGVYDHEKQKKQRVLVNIEAMVPASPDQFRPDSINQVLSYEYLIQAVEETAQVKHFNLVESFAEEVAAHCLSNFELFGIKVKVEKPEIINNAIVGVEIYRRSV